MAAKFFLSFRWYFGDLSHVKAEELLSRPGLRSGTFLVRKSSSCPGSFALSVLNQGKVFHYLIIGDSSGGVYVGLTSERKVLNTMEELVTYYRSGSNFLVCKLTDSCPKSSLVLRERLSSSGSDDMWYGIWTREGRKLPVHVRRLSPQLYSKTDVIHETDMTRQTVCSTGGPPARHAVKTDTSLSPYSRYLNTCTPFDNTCVPLCCFFTQHIV
ncbi:Tyrosine-protein kinase STK [Geodia barretti]|uniref:Tyrosine-protein kinase STK n=1 Tax=Geodia barretti TaxID=519541 RepID=A0AA35X6U0_GEOBA|nr:Tyrosine-protein kinase STK [Geodia barretti]